MAIYSRYSGAWRTAVAGSIRVRYGGAWKQAGKVYVKIGGVGGGWWYDTSYLGAPAAPVNFRVGKEHATDIELVWDLGVGGAPVVSYSWLQLTGGDIIVNSGTTTNRYVTIPNSSSPALYKYLLSANAAGGPSAAAPEIRRAVGSPAPANNYYW